MKSQTADTCRTGNILRQNHRASGISLWALCLLGCALSHSPVSAQSITCAGLLDDMTSLSGMAEFPKPAYTCKQFSSYDRASKTPADPGTWFANGDCGQYIRVEETKGHKEYVMMDAVGPGAIVRIWSANPAGVLRIYLDGAEEPVIQSPMNELLGGKFPGLARPISGEYSKGWNLYFPIPYAKSCKVTSDAGNFYYHVNYRTYAAGTKVETFNLKQLEALAPKVEKIKDRLADPRGSEEALGGKPTPLEIKISPGGTYRQEFKGSKAFTQLMLKCTAKDLEAALRGVLVRFRFDGEETVVAPLGDFFGSAPGINAFAALPLGMTKDGEMYCHWFMPFKASASIELVNAGKEEVTLAGKLSVADYRWTESSMHFHAKWRVAWDEPTRPMQDWNYLTAKGQGIFAGVSFSIDNPVKEWWGEGDEKIYVDGETFPGQFGTGTEDYYGYAWCSGELFTHAYHSQSRCDGPGNFGRTSVNRFDFLDRIPFSKDIKFDMELWHWKPNCCVNMAVTAYWYARPGGTDAFKQIQPGDTVVHPITPYVDPKVPGALEGEEMKIIRVVGKADAQPWDGLSGDKQLWWHQGMKPGDELVLGFNAPKAGKFHIIGRFLSAPDYGIHQFAINGQKLGEPVDFYSPTVQVGKEIELGVAELKQGENEFSSTLTGANDKAAKNYMLGFDYLLLKPVD